MFNKKLAKVIVSSQKLNELVQLSEESDLSQITAKSLSLYLTLLKHQTEGYSLMLIDMSGEKDSLLINLADL
jgi:hypothetical protein